MFKLSIVIPAYNEAAFIGELLERIVAVDTDRYGITKEIIVVDDGSRDQTFNIAKANEHVRVLQQENRGKGAAVQYGISQASGDYVIVQDADLEYDPNDYVVMLKKLLENPGSAIYGSRIKGQLASGEGMRFFPGRHKSQDFGPWLAGLILSIWTFILFGQWISDTLTAYKIYPKSFLSGLNVKTKGFETDHELTCKLFKAGIKIFEVPIAYQPRSKEQGKKIGPKDGFIAVWTLLRFRFVD